VSARVGVVGHVEFVEFIGVERLPRAGEVVHGDEPMHRVGGGGGVACAALAAFGGEVEFFTALGDDEPGRRSVAQLQERGVRVHAGARDQPTRRAVTLLERGGERTIVTLGERLEPHGSDPLPWEALAGCAAAYFTAGDNAALRHARRARVLVATPRAGSALASGVRLDALVYSAEDPTELAQAEALTECARIVVATEGVNGGRWWGEESGRWDPVAPPGPVLDTYGAGDTFAAVLAAALGAGDPMPDATALAAEWAAQALTYTGAPW
jgi:ribokinase